MTEAYKGGECVFRIEDWCDEVLRQVHFRPDHKAIRTELEAHYEDRSENLRKMGYGWDEARERTLAAMGDPVEIGRALNRVHKPWLGRLWMASRLLLVLLVLLSLRQVLSGYLPDIQMDFTPELVDYESDSVPYGYDEAENKETFYWQGEWERLYWESISDHRWKRAGYEIEVPYMGIWERTRDDGSVDYYLHFALVARDHRFWDGEIDSQGVRMVRSDGYPYINSSVYQRWTAQEERGVFSRQCRMNPFRQVHMFRVPLSDMPGEWMDVVFPDFAFRLDWKEAELG